MKQIKNVKLREAKKMPLPNYMAASEIKNKIDKGIKR